MNDVSRLEQAGDVTAALAASRHLALQVPDRSEAVRLAVDVALRANRRQAADALVKNDCGQMIPKVWARPMRRPMFTCAVIA